MSELTGIGGYASLMKTQKNPYERNLATTQGVLNSMPKDGGVTGLEGLGKLPLMYQQGVDSANAQSFDEQKAADEQKALSGVMEYQRAQDAAKMKLEQDKAVTDAQHKNAQTMKETLLSAEALSKSGNEGQAVVLLRKAGIPATSFTVDEHGPMAGMNNGVFWRLNKTGATVWDGEQNAWRPATEEDTAALKKDASAPKLTGHLVKDPKSTTGYSYAGDDGSIMTTNAPTPSELHPRAPKEPKAVDLAVEEKKINQVLAPSYQNLSRFLTSKQDDFAAAPDEATKMRILMSPGTLTPEGTKALQALNAKKEALINHLYTVDGATAGSALKATYQKQTPTAAPPGQVTAVATKVVNRIPYFKGDDGKWYEGPR